MSSKFSLTPFACVILYVYSGADTIGNQHFVPHNKVSLTQGLPVYFVVLRNGAVEYNVATFSELSFAVCWQGNLSRLVL